ncbi:hypothetical protein QAD02_002417 [Eretmocerus hayati]|uniref:Uncharacterized protein n=1 Tax=Eretmocerus hayati TaxID=131215 RepID=A0ACC2NJS7_9HYME|nr:hypothetical protein QAD02_002417 [Eretmocerus hayati]
MKKMKIISWNIAGAKNISHKTWGYLKEFEVIFLAETWLEGKEEAGIRSKIEKYDITTIEAKRQNKKSRASGGLLLATKKELEAEIRRLNEETLSCKVNTRTGEEGGSDIPERRRKSKDTTKNTEGQKMLKKLEQLGLIILNGGLNEDGEGKYTYIGARGKYGN